MAAQKRGNRQAQSLPPALYFANLGIRLYGLRAQGKNLSVHTALKDLGQYWLLELRNAVIHATQVKDTNAKLSLSGTMADITALFKDHLSIEEARKRGMLMGNAVPLEQLLSLLDTFSPDFAILIPTTNPCEEAIVSYFDFILKPGVQKFILIVIVVNALTLGLETNQAIVQATGPLLHIADQIALWIFVVELACKMLALKGKFVRDAWNIFDFCIVAISFVPAVGWLTVLRSMRVLRVLRLISGIPRLRVIVQSLLLSLPSIGWITLLMVVLFYTFAVMATKLFGAAFPEWFGSLGATFFTLFQVMTLESWAMGIARPVMETFPYAYLFFIPFVLLSAFIVLNVFIAIIIGGMDDARSQQKQEDDKNIEHDLHRELAALRSQIEKVESLLSAQTAKK